ncbi:MAG: hypothetical protein M1838_005996 [Thelocarpon superellum]|nr:MAG: hypothetical protein M1838_005996 [Thelocarpon superellum]
MRASVAVLALLAASAGVGAAPTAAWRPQTRTTAPIDCRNTKTGTDASCWTTLNMTSWLNDWFKTHTCREGDGFAHCFLRANGMPVTDCYDLNVQSCGSDITNHIDQSTPEVFYVLYNIYAINNFYNTWYAAAVAAAGQASGKIDAIVQTLNPVSKANVDLNIVLTALLAVLNFAPGAIGIAIGDMAKTIQHVASVASTVITTIPGVLKFVFPPTTVDSQRVEIGNLKTQLDHLETYLSGRLGPALNISLYDITVFTSLAELGAFSAYPAPAIDKSTANLDQALTTYLVSTCLQSNGWFGTVARDSNPQQMASNGSNHQYDLDCSSYDGDGICNMWWYDQQQNNAYSLVSNKSFRDNPHDNLRTIIDQGWSTMPQLFNSARQCNDDGDYNKGVRLNTDQGTFELQCISQLKMCTYDKRCVSDDCEYVDCDTDDGWGGAYNEDGLDMHVFSVPPGYLGPLLLQSDPTLVH